MRDKRPKTQGLEWLRHSMASFNGSGYADKATPETYVESYRAYKTMKHQSHAVWLVDNNLDFAMKLAAELCLANDSSHQPSQKALDRFRQFYNPDNASLL